MCGKYAVSLTGVVAMGLAVLVPGCKTPAEPTLAPPVGQAGLVPAKDIRPSSVEPPRTKLPDPPVIGRSRDDLHIAWAQLTQSDRLVAVIDGRAESEEYDDINLIVFSPDGKRVAYPAKRGSRWVLVVDGQAGPPYDLISISCIVSAPTASALRMERRKVTNGSS